MKIKPKEPVKVHLPRRSKRKVGTKKVSQLPYIYKKKSNKLTNIEKLPNEILCDIFSRLSVKDLFFNVRTVCRRWRDVAMTPQLWTKIEVEGDISTTILTKWVKSAVLLKDLTMTNRNDANIMTEMVSKHCRNLERIKLSNCWGSRKQRYVHSLPLCHLVTRCHKLYNFNFAQTRFASCKFFRLISKDKMTGKVLKKCSYYGPMNAKQMKTLLMALTEYDQNDSATIGNGAVKQRFNLKEIIRYVEEIQYHNSMMHDVWANIIMGDNDQQNNPLEVDI